MMRTPPVRPQPRIIAASLLLYRWLFKLGPTAFREEYAEPVLHDLRQYCYDAYRAQGFSGVLRLWPGLLGELVSGLLAEYWAEFSGRKRPMLPTMRRSMVATFWAFVLFALAYIALGRTADPVAPFNAVGRAHPEIAFTYNLIARSGMVALLALVLGGLPILGIAVKQAAPGGPRAVARLFVIRPKQALLLLGAALLMTLAALGFLLVTQWISGPLTCTASNGCIMGQSPLLIILSLAAIVGGITVGIFVVMAFTAALSLAVLRSDFSRGQLHFALAPIGILMLAMATTTVASATWTTRLWIDAPQFAASNAGLGSGQTMWVIALIVSMAVSTAITAGAFINGIRARQTRIA